VTQPAYNRRLGLIRLVGVYLTIAALVAGARPTPGGVAAGVLLVALGQALRVWASGHLIKNVSLVISGPYRYTRNPLYLGRLLVFAGLCVMARLPYGLNWLALVAGCTVFFGYYLPRKERVEPARLRVLHGEAYERYQREVPALWPTTTPYHDPGRGRWSAARASGNREHWMIAGLLAVTLFLFWRAYSP
jgi:protein-S-isoprenylcysteine O-methyltransferase Ste14